MARYAALTGGLLAFTVLLIGGPAYADPIITPLIAAAIASTSSALVASGAIVTTVAGIISGAIITGVGFGFKALAGAGKKNAASAPSFAGFGNEKLNLRQDSIDAQKLIYGRVRTSGLLAFVGTANTTFKDRLLYMSVAYAGHEIQEYSELWLDETRLTLDSGGQATNSKYTASGNDNYAKGTKLVRVRTYTGTENQTADSELVSRFSGWTSNHRGRGISHAVYRISHSPDRFPNGIPNPSAVLKGKKIFDPRSGLTVYSNNWALVVRDYLTDTKFGLGIPSSQINDDSVIASANVSDEDVTLKNGSTQKRYTIDGVIRSDEVHREVLEKMAAAAAGAIVYTQGQFYIHAGYYEAPAIDIDRSWLADSVKITPRVQRDELFNAVSGVFTNPAKNWQAGDFPIVTNPLYEAQDRNERLVKDIELPYVTEIERAQRLAKIALERGRQSIKVSLKCNLKAMQLKVWDMVSYTEPLLGFDQKVFRVINWAINDDFSIQVDLQEEAEGIYDWAAGEATTYDLAPDTELPDPLTVDPPQAVTVIENIYSSTEGSGVKTSAVVSWTESETAFLDRYEIEYKLSSASTYTPAGFTRATEFTIYDLAPGVYDFRVFARSTADVLSDPATTLKEIFGLTAPPADVQNFRVQAIDGQANLAWDQATDLDVKIGGLFEIRHTSKTTGASWSDGTPIGPALSGISTNQSLPLIAGTYMIKAVDSAGNKSVNAANIIMPNVNLTGMVTVDSATQDPGFTGTKTNMVVYSDGTLRLDGVGNFDDASGNFDDGIGFFDYGNGGGFETSGTYLFKSDAGDDYIDLGDTYSARVQVFFNGLVYDVAETFDEAGGLFDDRPGEFDGTDIDDVSTVFEIRTTDDDPSGSPTWGDWQQFQVGDYNFRACQIRMAVTSQQDSYNIAIDELSASITLASRLERFEDQSVLSGSPYLALTYTKAYFQKPNVQAILQGAQSGDTIKISHTISGSMYTGATIEVLNGGSNVARTVDVFINGV